jgi:MbtH protein
MNAPEVYRVVVNSEEQYSLLPVGVSNPPGWRDAGLTASHEACLAFIREHWTDMRPLSVRRRLNATGDSNA